ncbi:MAG: hypothetical protein P4L73_06335 [Caulobacteraceae bacterium]|nr:hypothetical protein [Caulobacteraceae bacterium]
MRDAQADNLDCLVLVILAGVDLAGVDLGFLPPHYARRWVEVGEMRAIRPDPHPLRSHFYPMSPRQAMLAPDR